MVRNSYSVLQPMRIQARKGSLAERQYYANSALPGGAWPMPAAISRGIDPAPLNDLMYHGGKVVPQMVFQNIYLGSGSDWAQGDIPLIDSAITRAMRDKRLNNVMAQYFLGKMLSCDVVQSLVLDDLKPVKLDEPDIQAKIIELYGTRKIARQDLGVTIFNLLLPPGSLLKLGNSSSIGGLGGYHGSVHFTSAGKRVTLYYSASVYSERLSSKKENGIVAFNKSWKNVVGTLYHELNEFRTDADVNDAIASGNNDLLGWMSRKGDECGDQPIFAATSLDLVFKEVTASEGSGKLPVQFMYSNAVHGAEGPITEPHA